MDPQYVGRFEIVRELEEGTSATLYLGYDPEHERDVAVRFTPAQPDEPKGSISRRRRQYRAAERVSARVQHANILAVYAMVSDEEGDALVMEHVPGARSLEQFTRPESLLPIQQAVAIAFTCASALDHVHRQGIVHGDIQPRNILLADDGSVKVTGFSALGDEDEDEDRSGRSPLMSSPLYLSPEQLRGDEGTGQSDLFALGVVLYELLGGQHPFQSNVIPAITQKIMNKAHTPIRTLRSSSPAVLDRILDKALKKHPAGRYKTGLDMAGDLSLVYDNVSLTEQDAADRDKIETVSKLRFFKEFAEPEVWEILYASYWQDFAPDDVIVSEGDAGNSFYVLVSGEVIVRKGERDIDVLHKGDCFGEIGFVTQNERMASIIAKEFVTVMEIRAPLVERVSQRCQIRFQRAFLDVLAERLTRATERLSQI